MPVRVRPHKTAGQVGFDIEREASVYIIRDVFDPFYPLCRIFEIINAFSTDEHYFRSFILIWYTRLIIHAVIRWYKSHSYMFLHYLNESRSIKVPFML